MVNAASQHANQFLEDICHVSLCSFITYLFIEFLELQLGKIFSVIISHFLQLFLSIVWDWKQIVFLPTKLIIDIQFFYVFHVYPSFLMYLAHQLRHQIRSDQISHSVVSDSLRPHESQHARPPCPPPTPGVHSDSLPLSQ